MTDLKFDFSGSTIKTDEELELAAGGPKREDTSKVFKPGKHDVVIEAVEYVGQASDPNWGKLKLTLKGTGLKQTLDWLTIPVKDTMYQTKSGKSSPYMFQRIKRFAEAVGIKLSVNNLRDGMISLLGKSGEALKGKTVGVVIGYKQAYVNYAGKDEAGLIRFKITFPATKNQAETDLVGPDGKVMMFPDRDSAMEHAVAASIPLDRYPNVLEYTEPTVKATVNGSNW